MTPETESDKVIWRHELQQWFGVTSETMRRWLRGNKLPTPDVAMSRKTLGWRVSTLHQAGINIPA